MNHPIEQAREILARHVDWGGAVPRDNVVFRSQAEAAIAEALTPQPPSEEVVEAVARAMASSFEHWQTWAPEARAAIAAMPSIPRDEKIEDWWKPDPEDPFWMLEADDGEWLKNEHSLLGTRDATKALRFPTADSAHACRRRLSGNKAKWWGAKPTEHLWMNLSTIPQESDAEVTEAQGTMSVPMYDRCDTYVAGQYVFNYLRTFLAAAGIDASKCKLVVELPDRDTQRQLVSAVQRDSKGPPRSAGRIGNHSGLWQGVEYEFSVKGWNDTAMTSARDREQPK